MNWATKFAIQNFKKGDDIDCTVVSDHTLNLRVENNPPVLVYISDAYEIERATADEILAIQPNLDFICGFRKDCLWHGNAIEYLEANNVGWGDFKTLAHGALGGNANSADQKRYHFGARILRQMGGIGLVREFDRVFLVTRSDGTTVRLVMAHEYEPTADFVRSLWERWEPFDLIFNTDPNQRTTPNAYAVASALGLSILNASDTMRFIRKRS